VVSAPAGPGVFGAVTAHMLTYLVLHRLWYPESSRWSISVEAPLPTSSTVAVLGSPVRRINAHEIVGFGCYQLSS